MTPIPAFRHRSHPSAVAVVAWGLMALWALAWLAGPTLLSMAGLALNPHGHADLYAHGLRLWMPAAGGACPTRWTC
ncbi:MAG: hypothetical protein U1E02_24995 [Hydrogenophaga sp.]|jgi:hypothetical protein|uniref:hypothetical protein n=1 Tax=Hydrogenophaga sp. TaxID=1904254 RepID=UPI002728DAC9|nr:hypothetical protein [Hydrogenophaga sp.]MDO9131758.1 hypothetical protein [Hydrogenophaga sp.]MDP2249247.1 hypothetical protein [Hydrogenophaga sp.]MDZ4127392.1 hypothetical protein [Hydrogenophaga sp.]